MADYLKLAPYRVGGAGREYHASTFVSTLEGAVTDNSCVTDTVDDSDEADVDDEGEGDNDDYDEGDAGDVEGDSEED